MTDEEQPRSTGELPAAEQTAPEQTAQAPTPEPAAEPPTSSQPTPKPPVPKPSNIPKPSSIPKPGPRPGPPPTATATATAQTTPASPAPPEPAPGSAAAPAPTGPAGGAEAPLDPAEVAAAAAFGRVDDQGNVYLREDAGERVVGQYPGVTADEAMTLYIRRYLDLKAQVDLFAARLEQLNARDIDTTLATLTEAVSEPAVVGDVSGLRSHVQALATRAEKRKEDLAAQRAAAKERALAQRTQIVEAAEKIAGRDPAKIQWRSEGQRLRELLEEWKQAQRSGPRLDRGLEDGLWKRFSAARTGFDRNRRQHFAELDKHQAQVKATKERLIERAEALSGSRNWGPTSAAYRDLMQEWKRAGRAARKDDDALWARFRAAQDVFFDARNEANAATDAEYAQNLEVKLKLLEQAEALVPVTDLAAAKAALRTLQEQWDEAGKVPRADIQRVEGRMRAVETAIREAEQAKWDKSNPRVRARAEGAAAQLEAAIAGLQDDLTKARESGDSKRIAQAQEALEARQAWLEQVLRAAEDAG